MIPLPVAPLTGVTVLVTRPEDQGRSLGAHIAALGGEPILFPSVVIESIESAADPRTYDWIVFTSINAVKHGLQRVRRSDTTRIAAIGKSTAAALNDFEVSIDAVPDRDAASETLLMHPAFANVAGQGVLLVKGEGGRDLLRDTFKQRGASVDVLEVYRRVRPTADASRLQELEQKWRDDGVDIVTLTSVEVLENLLAMLTAQGRGLLGATAFVTVSDRIVAAARAQGLTGAGVVARGADDASIVGAIAAWHARAR